MTYPSGDQQLFIQDILDALTIDTSSLLEH